MSLTLPILALASCGALPDVTAFKEASHGIYAATERVSQVFEGDVSQIQFSGSQSLQFPPGSGTHISGDLETLFGLVWDPHVDATLAMAAYADSLAELASSPESAAKRVGQLADSVSQVFSAAAGRALPGGLTSAAQTIVRGIAKWKVLSEMHEATEALDPDIQQFGVVLSSSFGAVGAFVNNMITHIDTLEQLDPVWKSRIARITTYKRLVKAYRGKVPASIAAAETSQLALVRQDLSALTEERASNKYQRAKRSLSGILDIVAATQGTIAEWKKQHGQIARALKNERTLSAPRLLQKALALREIYGDIKSDLDKE